MLPKGRILRGAVVVALSSIGASVLVGLPAGASAQSVAAAPAKGLLTAAQAKSLGFTKTADKPITSSKTGVTGCAKGAQEAFEDASSKTGMISQVLVCKSTTVATGLLKKERKVGTALASMKPPKQLGSTAIERAASGSTYAIYWQRGKLLELVALDTDVAASSSSTTTTPTPAVPLTAKQQQTLVKTALKQDAAAH